MAIFKKKDREQEIPQLPELPKLPELPDFPENDFVPEDEGVPQLPSLPESSPSKSSRDSIKEAVAGERGDNLEEEFEEKDRRRREVEMEELEERRRPQRPSAREESGQRYASRLAEPEPIFVRMDKFEEGSKEFEEVRRKVVEMEALFENVKKIKEKEEKELEFWGEEIRKIKEKIENIDRNIFSKL